MDGLFSGARPCGHVVQRMGELASARVRNKDAPCLADVGIEEAGMSDRVELMEAALEGHPEGIALLNAVGRVLFWNRAAEAMTGFAGIEMVARTIPWELEPLLHVEGAEDEAGPQEESRGLRGALVHGQHKLGHDLAVALRRLILRGGMGERIGTAILFHPAECVDALPHGEVGGNSAMEATQANLEERVEELHGEFLRRGAPFGLLWITVDQAHELRKTHGARACEAMLERMERTLVAGLHPSEEMGRWGEDEFLVLAHESDTVALAARAQALAGLARTAEFRWWGDRVSLTVSVGAGQAGPAETLAELLEQTQAAMHASIHAGGNHVTAAPGRPTCSRS